MSTVIPILISGIAFGMLYALLGVGLVLIYRGSKVINFAFGAVIGLLAYVSYALLRHVHPEAVAIVLAFGVAVIAGYLLRVIVVTTQDRFGAQPLRARGLFDDDTVLKMIVGTLGVALIIEGVEPVIWGSQTLQLPFNLPGGAVMVSGVAVTWANITIVLVAGGMIALIALLLNRTRIGFEVRALFSNPYAANVMGLRVSRSFTVVWILGTVTGLAAAFLSSSVIYISSGSYDSVAFVAFVAIVLGGLESLAGAVLGGLIVGVAESFIDAYLSSQVDQLILLALAVVVLTLRPQGLLSASKTSVGRL